jgi:hypothetical protein
MAKQRTGAVSAGSRATHNSSLENGNGVNSTELEALAYALWQARGCPEGSPDIDWLEAEKQIRARMDEVATSQNSEPLLVRRSGA